MLPNMSGARRIEYVDGLRGVAVSMVVLHHAVFLRSPGTGIGPLGVSLFFVLSGFCLGYPVLRTGELDLRTFWLRRARRILPPYYAALAIYTVFAVLWTRAGLVPLQPSGGSPSAADVLAHVALIHNLVPAFMQRIDGPFWSLGLEWQWYAAFPLLLLCFTRWPWATLTMTLILAVGWVVAAPWLGGWRGIELPPARLFEFCCGLACASTLVRGRGGSAWLPTAVAAGALAILTRWPDELFGRLPVYYVVAAVGFAAALLAADRSPLLTRALSVRPLLWLGGISYSVYLVHAPALAALEQCLSPVSPVAAQVLGVTLSIALGWVFCFLFERPAIAWSRRVQSRSRSDADVGTGIAGSKRLILGPPRTAAKKVLVAPSKVERTPPTAH